MPELFEQSSDAAVVGTIAHAGIEETLTNGPDSAWNAMNNAFGVEVEKGIQWTTMTVDDLMPMAERCYHAWSSDIRPRVPTGGRCEVAFEVELFKLPDGRVVYIDGTADYLAPDGVIWDWKTSGRKYYAREKQKSAIQPTMYGLAAVLGGFGDEVSYDWPIDFRYGVMVKGKTRATAQILPITRTSDHARWLIERIRQYTDMLLNFGLDRPWPRNDESGLCSDRWCPAWDHCRGKFLDWRDDVPVELSPPIDTSSTPTPTALAA